jgi:hypothetical protein
MLILLIIWLFLGTCCWSLGTLLLEFCFPHAIAEQSDRFWLSLWLGIVILCNLLLVISFFTPLTTTVGITVWTIAITTAVLWRKTRLELQELFSSFDRRSIYISIVTAMLVGIFASILTMWYDTGLYHYQVIKWLANFGTVLGLGSIHYPFGLPATFFTISAVLEQSILTNRATGAVVGFITLVFLGQLLSGVNKITDANQKKSFSDYFLATYTSYSLISMCIYGFTILKSTSPDVIVAFMSGIPLWLMLLYQQNRNQSTCLIAVLLASGLVSFKWSGLVILGVVYLWAIFNLPKKNFREFIFNAMLISVTAFLPLIPTLSYGFITSGCPLYPSGILCLDVPWGVGKLRAEEVKLAISNWQKWGTFTPPDPNPWGWLIPWAQREAYAVIQICVSLTCGFLIWFQSPKNIEEWRPISKYILGMGLGGIIYALILSPSIRFIIGYVNTICAFWLTQFIFCRTLSKKWERRLWIFLITVWFIPIIYFPIFHDRNPDLLLPQELKPVTQLQIKQAIDFSYLVPQNDDRCWSADLPCTPENLDRVRLLNPDRGIGGGFRRAE